MSASPQRIVLYGEHDLERSRSEQAVIAAAQTADHPITTLDLKTVSEASFAETLGTVGLFGGQRLLRLYNLEKVRSSKTLATYLEQLETTPDDVLIVIQGKMTPAKKKLFSKTWRLKDHPLPAVLFQFLESIQVASIYECLDLYHQVIATESEWSVHALAARQFRLLLAAKTGAPLLAPPFAHRKLQSQAKKFTVAELVQNLHTLYDIERAIKSGLTPLTWSQQFAILLTRLYTKK